MKIFQCSEIVLQEISRFFHCSEREVLKIFPASFSVTHILTYILNYQFLTLMIKLFCIYIFIP